MNTASTIVLFAVLAAFAIGSFSWVTQRDIFSITNIRVETLTGKELTHVNVLTLRSATAHIKGNFFTVDLDASRAAFESVPWVSRSTLRREWPNHLVVSLAEHTALGTWGTDGRLLSTDGEVFTANMAEADEDQELPSFSGPEGSEKDVLAHFSKLREWFAPLKLVPLSLSLSTRYAWTVKLNNGLSVALGHEQNEAMLKARVDRFISIYPQLVLRLSDIDTVDMRYPNGLSLSAKGLMIPADGKKITYASAVKPALKGVVKRQN
jgi:cell division protein FtsQ